MGILHGVHGRGGLVLGGHYLPDSISATKEIRYCAAKYSEMLAAVRQYEAVFVYRSRAWRGTAAADEYSVIEDSRGNWAVQRNGGAVEVAGAEAVERLGRDWLGWGSCRARAPHTCEMRSLNGRRGRTLRNVGSVRINYGLVHH